MPRRIGKADASELEREGPPTFTEQPTSNSKLRGPISTTAGPGPTGPVPSLLDAAKAVLDANGDPSGSLGDQVAAREAVRQAVEAADK